MNQRYRLTSFCRQTVGTWPSAASWILVFTLNLCGSGAVAEEPLTSAPELQEVSDLAQPEVTAEDKEKVPPESPPSGQKPLDESTDPPPAGGAEKLVGDEEDPLQLIDEALTAMDEAAAELEASPPSDKAVERQNHAVEQLKKLLESAQQQQQQQQQQSQNQSQQQRSQKNRNQSRQKSQGRDGQEPMGADGRRRQDDENSRESSERVDGARQGRPTDSPLTGPRTNAVWGHLPPREQDALFRSLSDKFIPEYEAMIRKYYDALAEEK